MAVKGLKKQVDTLHSRLVRERDVVCQYHPDPADCAGNLQCCHIVSRRYLTTRWQMENAVAMCARAHVSMTARPDEWAVWVDDRFGPGFYQAKAREAQQSPPLKGAKWWAAELERLEAMPRRDVLGWTNP
ncbi:MAG: hypothetical protein GY698_03640 [Actinomycetia bacterium]|nr:hypothetical protein [Actinomycetes bacterium]